MNYAWLGAAVRPTSRTSLALVEVAVVVADDDFVWHPGSSLAVPLEQPSGWLDDLEGEDPALAVTYRRNGLAKVVSSGGMAPREAERVLCEVLSSGLPCRPVVANMGVWKAISDQMPALVRSLSDDAIDLSSVWEFTDAFVTPHPSITRRRIRYRAMQDLVNLLNETQQLTEAFTLDNRR